jgi:hypothetical protein
MYMARHRTIGRPRARSSSVNDTGSARTAGSMSNRPCGSPQRANTFEIARITPWTANQWSRLLTGPCTIELS